MAASPVAALSAPRPSLAEPVQLPLFGKKDAPLPQVEKIAEPSRHPWAWLLRRVFAADVLECIRCGGALRLVKIATKPDEIARALGEQTRPPSTELAVTVCGQLRLEGFKPKPDDGVVTDIDIEALSEACASR